MDYLSRVARAMSELREIRDELEELYNRTHSFGQVFRSLARRVDFRTPARRAAILEERACILGVIFFEEGASAYMEEVRREWIYWCYVSSAASSLVEILRKTQMEVEGEGRYGVRGPWKGLRCYKDSIGNARLLEDDLGEGRPKPAVE